MSEDAHDALAKALAAIVARLGEAVLEDRRRVTALLADTIPGHGRQVRLLGIAIDNGAARAISRARLDQIELEVDRYAQRIDSDLGVRKAITLPVLRAIAFAAGRGALPSLYPAIETSSQVRGDASPVPEEESWIGVSDESVVATPLPASPPPPAPPPPAAAPEQPGFFARPRRPARVATPAAAATPVASPQPAPPPEPQPAPPAASSPPPAPSPVAASPAAAIIEPSPIEPPPVAPPPIAPPSVEPASVEPSSTAPSPLPVQKKSTVSNALLFAWPVVVVGTAIWLGSNANDLVEAREYCWRESSAGKVLPALEVAIALIAVLAVAALPVLWLYFRLSRRARLANCAWLLACASMPAFVHGLRVCEHVTMRFYDWEIALPSAIAIVYVAYFLFSRRARGVFVR